MTSSDTVTGADPGFTKGGCLNEDSLTRHSGNGTVANPLSRLLAAVGGGCGSPLPRKAQKLEQLGYFKLQETVSNDVQLANY